MKNKFKILIIKKILINKKNNLYNTYQKLVLLLIQTYILKFINQKSFYI